MEITLNKVNERRVSMKFVKLTLLLLLILVISVKSEAKTKIIHTGVKVDLIKRWNKVNSEYLIIKSPPLYHERDTAAYTKGYAVELSDVVNGQLTRSIYDYHEDQSSLNVFEQISKSVANLEYETLFSCTKLSCGEVNGWKLYLSDLISGDANKQFFGVAKKSLQDGSFEYISYYITEIDNQPRALIDVVIAPKEHNFDLIVHSEQILKNLMKDGRVILNGLNFTVGSSQLKPESRTVIQSMSNIIKKYPLESFAIVGHTDSTGDYFSNIELSINRANVVRLELINKYKVNASQILANGVGPLTPLTSNRDELSRSLNRRVELVQL